MTRGQAYKLLTKMMSNQNLIRHGLAVEAIMRALCRELHQRHPGGERSEPIGSKDSIASLQNDSEEFDEEEWAIVGLMHDADYEVIDKNPERHTLVTEEKLRPLGVSDRIINGIKAHHSHIKPKRENLMESSVYAADDMSGLITALALVKNRKLANVTVENIVKKFGEKNFAAGVNREQISTGIKELNLSLEEFAKIALQAMQGISDELGL